MFCTICVCTFLAKNMNYVYIHNTYFNLAKLLNSSLENFSPSVQSACATRQARPSRPVAQGTTASASSKAASVTASPTWSARTATAALQTPGTWPVVRAASSAIATPVTPLDRPATRWVWQGLTPHLQSVAAVIPLAALIRMFSQCGWALWTQVLTCGSDLLPQERITTEFRIILYNNCYTQTN